MPATGPEVAPVSLRYALLGFLDVAPETGYDLKKNLDLSTQHFWYAGLNQIYPTLQSLEEEGLARSHVEPQDGKPDRRVYEITAEGREELRQWLAQPLDELSPSKNVGLMKIFFAGSLERKEILRQLRRQLHLHRRQLEEYEATAGVIQEIVKRTGQHRRGVLWELVRELGQRHEEAYVGWLERAIEVVEAEIPPGPAA